VQTRCLGEISKWGDLDVLYFRPNQPRSRLAWRSQRNRSPPANVYAPTRVEQVTTHQVEGRVCGEHDGNAGYDERVACAVQGGETGDENCERYDEQGPQPLRPDRAKPSEDHRQGRHLEQKDHCEE